MNVQQLIEALEKLDRSLDVWIKVDGELNTVDIVGIDEEGDVIITGDCF